jgi:S1-C subfamily serine protease
VTIDESTAVPNFTELAPLIDENGCVAVLEVERDSPSWKAGLRPGMFIAAVERKRVATPGEFFAAVEQRSGTVELTVITGLRQRSPLRVAPLSGP